MISVVLQQPMFYAVITYKENLPDEQRLYDRCITTRLCIYVEPRHFSSLKALRLLDPMVTNS